MKESWANGEFSASFDAEFVARHAAAHGACSAFKEVVDIDAEQLFEDKDD